MAWEKMVSILIGLMLAMSPIAAEPAQCPPGVQQLRIYEIFEGNKAAFHDRFRDHAQRIMKRLGFNIVTMWESRLGDRTEFVYLLQWPDEATMKQRWAQFMADEEWSRIKKEWAAAHGQAVGEIQDRTLKRTDYSPC
jgi:heme-degrading monooxygenase HmoA